MPRLDPVMTFVEVVRAGSFSAAAERLEMPRSTVSLHIKTLETELGTRLMKRSTRSFALTDDGQRLFDQSASGLQTLLTALENVRGRPGELRGLIRIAAPADFPASFLAGAVTEFREMHPAVRFQIMMSSTTADLIDDNFDLAVRMGNRGNQDRVERPLQNIHWRFCVSRDRVGDTGVPRSIGEIDRFLSPASDLRKFLESTVLGNEQLPPAEVTADNLALLRDLVLSGCGTALLPAGMCAEAIESGTVVTCLEDKTAVATRLVLTFPSRADILPRVRAFADMLSSQF
ncbi:LysR family transcriptional regulator [Stakelama tenebrarum]|uniref:LysR family transcriptional regulator n=1 Tax=Stakelama tenebrarum TaxID=2711215 RepID=A0A6G6Y246_9SPHN|nr:LysR family transcriptional regulator [Sphingosinithalassobacter tenebrarum]QIG78995.1 LysR family transcriptional regulator [Sphingosinithalassobacter tenebrarum]